MEVWEYQLQISWKITTNWFNHFADELQRSIPCNSWPLELAVHVSEYICEVLILEYKNHTWLSQRTLAPAHLCNYEDYKVHFYELLKFKRTMELELPAASFYLQSWRHQWLSSLPWALGPGDLCLGLSERTWGLMSCLGPMAGWRGRRKGPMLAWCAEGAGHGHSWMPLGPRQAKG